MQSVGESLRAARLDLGLTLEQVSARTRISVKNLRAIEADELSTISSAFFYKSFVRQFAVELGLDYSLLSPAVQAAVSTIPEPAIPGHGNTPPLRISRLRRKRDSGVRSLLSVASLPVMLVACSTVYAMWQNSRAEIQASLGSFVQSVTSTSASAQSGKKANHDPRPAAPAVSNSQTHPVAPYPAAPPSEMTRSDSNGSKPFELRLSALEATWLSVVADGKEIFSGTLHEAESKVLEGYETARIRTGNAGGLSVEFNGKSIGTLGARGQIRTVLFKSDSYEIVPAAAHIALIRFSPEGE